MLFVATKFLSILTSPSGIAVVLLALGVVLLWTSWWRRGRGILTVLGLLSVLVPLSDIGSIAAAKLEDRFPGNPPLPSHIDGIIVLGGMIDQFISESRKQPALNEASERLFETARLAKAHPEARVVFSGGSGAPLRPKPTEAEYAVPVLIELGVDPGRIIIEDKSRDTYENALFSREIAQPKPGDVWVLVTSAWHMPRSVGVFRHVGWSVLPYPVDYLTFSAADRARESSFRLPRLEILRQAAHEWQGLVYYRLAGRTDALFPAP